MKNQLKTLMLIGTLTALVIGVGSVFAPEWVYGFTALAIALNFAAYFYSDRLVLRMHGARELPPGQLPELHRMVEELSVRAEIPKPRIFVMEDGQPNAFATGRNPEVGVVAVTTGILRLLSARELRGVLAHEIAHIKNRDILVSSIAAILASVVTYLAHALSFLPIFGRSDSNEEEQGSASGGILLALFAPMAAFLIQMGISRSREYLADETGARIAGDPEALAGALAKLHQAAELLPTDNPQPATASLFIVNPLAGASSVMSWFSTHPDIEERIRRLRAMAIEDRFSA